jgi:hypothetical protein
MDGKEDSPRKKQRANMKMYFKSGELDLQNVGQKK